MTHKCQHANSGILCCYSCKPQQPQCSARIKWGGQVWRYTCNDTDYLHLQTVSSRLVTLCPRYKFYVLWKMNDPNVRDLNNVTTSLEHDIIVKPLSILAQFQKGIKRTNSNPGSGNPVGFKSSFIKRGLKFSSSSSNINIRSVFSQS